MNENSKGVEQTPLHSRLDLQAARNAIRSYEHKNVVIIGDEQADSDEDQQHSAHPGVIDLTDLAYRGERIDYVSD